MTPITSAAMFARTWFVEQWQTPGASLKRRNRLGVSARLMVSASHFESAKALEV